MQIFSDISFLYLLKKEVILTFRQPSLRGLQPIFDC